MITTLPRIIRIASFVLACLFSFSNTSWGASSNQEPSLYEKLKDVNAQWVHHVDRVPQKNIHFNSDRDKIQFHLEQVVESFKLVSPDDWSTDQYQNRQKLLNVLASYAERKVFPTNLYHSERTPYFIDDFGVHCAVGYLIQQSGHGDLSNRISENYNYEYIEDMPSEDLTVWANEFGFSIDELKWIQPGYPPAPLGTLGNGTNGNVEKVYADDFDQRMIFVGDFTTVDLQACSNIGVYQNEQFSCLGGGLNGLVNDVIATQDGVYVSGKIEANGSSYPLAFFDGATWQYFAIPGRGGATGTAIIEHSSTSLELSVQHISLNDNEEIWSFNSNTTWSLEAEVNGPILDIESTSLGNIFVGHFDLFTSHTGVSYTVSVSNVVIQPASSSDWYGLGSEISDTVKTVKEIGTDLYFGGSCSIDPTTSNTCLTRYSNGALESLIQANYFIDSASISINDLAYLSGDELIVGGDFDYTPLMGMYGMSLLSYHLTNGYISGLGFLDQSVNSLTYQDNDLFIGGDFEFQFNTQPLNHLARITSTIGIDEKSLEINAYPNPFTTVVTIDGFEPNARYSIYDLSGKVVRFDERLLDGKIDLSELENGTYILQLDTELGIATQRIVKSSL